MCVKEVTWFGDHLLFPVRGTGTLALAKAVAFIQERERDDIV